MPRLRTVLAACLLVLLLSAGATALLSRVQRLHGEVTLDRSAHPAKRRTQPLRHPPVKVRTRRREAPVPDPGMAVAAPGPAPVPAPEPRILSAPAPRYPIAALDAMRQGLVEVRVRLDAGGHVVDASVAQSSGDPALDQSALQAVRRWTFTLPPHARRDTVLPIRFQIDGAPR